jgi:hypothetical protein
VVQIHSPRPTLLELTTYITRKSESPVGGEFRKRPEFLGFLSGQEEPGMWDFFKRYPWVRKTVKYRDSDELSRRLIDGLLKRPARSG